jgi:hypothetical protein
LRTSSCVSFGCSKKESCSGGWSIEKSLLYRAIAESDTSERITASCVILSPSAIFPSSDKNLRALEHDAELFKPRKIKSASVCGEDALCAGYADARNAKDPRTARG